MPISKKQFKFILTSIFGNIIEWYDFALYGYFASIIAKLFFPVTSNSLSLIMALAVFASGFIVRPVGGIIFGHIEDKYGRRTALIGLLPTYQKIGIYAPILLTVLRLLQGIAVSGELTGSGIFLIECAPNCVFRPNRTSIPVCKQTVIPETSEHLFWFIRTSSPAHGGIIC